jgi:hypothetical protein
VLLSVVLHGLTAGPIGRAFERAREGRSTVRTRTEEIAADR